MSQQGAPIFDSMQAPTRWILAISQYWHERGWAPNWQLACDFVAVSHMSMSSPRTYVFVDVVLGISLGRDGQPFWTTFFGIRRDGTPTAFEACDLYLRVVEAGGGTSSTENWVITMNAEEALDYINAREAELVGA